ncbi:MAG: two-component system response regulator [Firmicutes bacterium HGW-Firmicutes-11]|jgi:putative two-component system response regulator|nr:MAG: two-component system response regulator [Firmicutes bacterium HGW-Firmicutes-11]
MKVLIADDSATDVAIIKSILNDIEVAVARDGIEAIELLHDGADIDLMLLDLNMPRMDGFQVLEAAREDLERFGIVTLILTNANELESEIKGLELGAVDYIRKPLNFQSLRKRIEVHNSLQHARMELESTNASLEQIVQDRTEELIHTRDITIQALTGLLEVRNIESGNHTKRTQWMMKALSEQLRLQGKYQELLTDTYINDLFSTAPLHDIGKVGIPDKILLKPGRLTSEEFEIMKKHVDYGVAALQPGIGHLPPGGFIDTAMEIISAHHERYNGTGYPKGLTGTEIPLPGRLMAIIDVYDALVSERVYKAAIEHEVAMEMIREESGQHFDPEIVEAFFGIEETIKEIADIYIQH